MSEYNETIPATITAAMEKNGLTETGLAAKVGRTQITVRRWTRGENTPSAADLGAIADALNTSADHLLGRPAGQ